jgi:hypothetical protein
MKYLAAEGQPLTRWEREAKRYSSLPRVDHRRAGWFKICGVARYDRHPMDKSRGSDDHIALCARVWNIPLLIWCLDVVML